MKQYDKYKDSGVEWIGEIPDHWKVCRFKNMIELKTISSDSNIRIGLENIESQTGKFITNSTEFGGNGVAFKNGDILYGKLRPYLQKVWLAEFEGNAIGDFFVFAIKKCAFPTYVKYILLSDGFTKMADSSTFGAKMPRVSSDFILCLPFYLPPLPEQRTIATYLDIKCTEIDSLVSLQEEMISELQAYKQSVITESVTKGLNPNVTMKDSGVEWIGKIPEEWNVCKIQNLVNLQSGRNLTTEQITEDGLYPVYGGNGIRGYYTNYTNEGNYVLIGRQGALCGNINYAEGKFWPTEHAVVCYPKVKLIVTWLGEKLRSMNLGQNSLASAQPGLAVERIKQLPITVPPLPEQQQIATYLDTKCAEIDSLITIKQQKIDELKKYKKSIIFEYVTGKKAVPTTIENN